MNLHLPISDQAPSTVRSNTRHQPTPRDLILLDVPASIKVSPSGNHAVISIRTTNWQENRYETFCQLYDVERETSHLLTRRGNVNQVEWLDDQTIAVLKEETGAESKAQVWLYEGLIGDGWAVTEHESGVTGFKPFAGGILYWGNRPDRKEDQERSDYFGNHIHFEQEKSKTALYYIGLAELRAYRAQLRHTTAEESKKLVYPAVEVSTLLTDPFSIRQVIPCPTGMAIYLNCWLRDDLVYYHTTNSYRITLDVGTVLQEYCRRRAELGDIDETTTVDISDLGEVTQLPLPPGATITAVSPSGQTLAISHQGRDEKIYTRSDLWLLDRDKALAIEGNTTCLAHMHNISHILDRDVMNVQWTRLGIFGAYVDGTCIRLAQFSQDSVPMPIDLQNIHLVGAYHVGESGHLGIIGENATSYPEAYLTKPPQCGITWQCRQVSNFGAAITNWHLGSIETIRWVSKDGTEIEGVLRKPANFDPNKQYPLVFVVHGGPSGFSGMALLSHTDRMYYPAVQFANDEMLVLYPNYRGSTGRGQSFTELNVNNLGIGDLWDLESAIDHLAELGWIDEGLIGCMGWSQGGYISAFAGLHSNRFRTVSVGAGISDWYTYHISNDIPYFTTDYLSGSPFHNRKNYAPTAPMSNIANAKTPMLIQHGAEDRRVPLSNAMELYRGLQARGVPVELYIYPDMGHPITRPRENHAVMCQNLAWFRQHLLMAKEEGAT